MSKPDRILRFFALVVAGCSVAYGQSIFATLTGVVSDSSEAVIPGAKVTLTNALSGDVRRTVTNGEGYFTFASVPAATYKMTVEASGFLTHEQANISFTGAER